jgi:GalNAc-alpha-(1->4)-GalNAc-alpha-(1->3)-diNAcBac-PP-undecaprenol alpha-1,4-N-acetyl-D-galactosaminyltransferase
MGEKNNKILLIMPRIYYGGAETQFRYFAEYCNKHNVEMYVAVENKDGNREDIENFKELNKNIKFIEYKNSSAGYTTSNFLMKNIRKIKGLFNLLFKTFFICVRFKDISTVIVYDGFGLKLTFLFKLFGKRVIYSERNSGKETLGSFFNKFNLKKADIVCANSLPAKKYIEDNSDINVQLIYNGIKVKDIVETKQKSEGEFNILVPARISKVKNIKTIVESLTLIDCKYKVWLCGAVEEQHYCEEVKEYIKKNNLENIVFTGYTNNILDYYKKADLVILASFSEGMPNVILESFANKRMIISSDIEMNRAIMKDEKFVFNPNSPSELAEKIKMVMNMSEVEKNATVEKNFEYIKDNFSVDKMVNSYLNLVNGLENKNE